MDNKFQLGQLGVSWVLIMIWRLNYNLMVPNCIAKTFVPKDLRFVLGLFGRTKRWKKVWDAP